MWSDEVYITLLQIIEDLMPTNIVVPVTMEIQLIINNSFLHGHGCRFAIK